MSDHDFRIWNTEVWDILASYNPEVIPLYLKLAIPELRKNFNVPKIRVENYQDIVKIIGNIKYNFQDKNVKVYFRGQRNNYDFYQFPSFFRGFLNEYTKLIRPNEINDLFLQKSYGKNKQKEDDIRFYLEGLMGFIQQVGGIRNNLDYRGKPINYLALESILSHYGYKTRWLDLVDNLPIAIWFSVFNLERLNYSYDKEKENNSYIFLHGVQIDKKIAPGIWEGSTQRFVDLREAFPPISLRPHLQHAVMMCDKRLLTEQAQNYSLTDFYFYANYSKYLLAIIEFDKEKGIEWLNQRNLEQNSFLNFKNLFPSPEDDIMFDWLIRNPAEVPWNYVDKYGSDYLIPYMNDDKIFGKVEHYGYNRN